MLLYTFILCGKNLVLYEKAHGIKDHVQQVMVCTLSTPCVLKIRSHGNAFDHYEGSYLLTLRDGITLDPSNYCESVINAYTIR